MKASIVDLRYHMKDVLKALARNESVEVLYRGKVKGVIVPKISQKNCILAKEHEAFGIYKNARNLVDQEMQALRKMRYHDI